MKYREIVEQTGFYPRYNVEDDIRDLSLTYDKPSSRILHSMIGIKTIALLKKIEKDNNHSWYQEILERANKKGINDVALFYRGNKITYKEMFEKADAYARSFATLGIQKGDEIPCCLSNTPELVYIMLAANKMGVKLNLFGTNLDSDYLSSILDKCSHQAIFISDVNYEKISSVVNTHKYDKKIVVSLADSLPEHPELCDEYEPELASYYHYDNLLPSIKEKDNSVVGISDFEKIGYNYDLPIVDDNDLDTEFTVTYTSGSTRKGYPKQIIHCNRSYIIGGIYNDSNLTGSPSVPEIRGLAHIHPDSNTNLVTCISDNLLKHGSVALEPEYDASKLLDYIILNKPVHLDATTSFLIEAAKQYLVEKRFHQDGKGRKLPFMLVAMAVGEKTSPGEEKFINRFLREASAGSGIKLNGIRLPYAPMSIGGGDCEHGGIYYSLLKGLQQLKTVTKIGKGDYGMTPVPFSTVTALKLNSDGEYEECDYGEYGLIVANSITTMKGYKDNPDQTLKKVIRDKYGRDWVSCDTYGCINKIGNAIIKGRLEDTIVDECGVEYPCFIIEDVVCKDTKNIMSCTITKYATDSGDIPIINIEFSPLHKKSVSSILRSLESRLRAKFPHSICDKMLIRIMDSEHKYPTTGSGKRDVVAIEQMGIDNTYKIKNGELLKYTEDGYQLKKVRK